MFKSWLIPKVEDKPVKLNVINAIELKPNATYLLLADNRHISRDDMQQVIREVKKQGIKNVVGFMLSGRLEDSIQLVERQTRPRKK